MNRRTAALLSTMSDGMGAAVAAGGAIGSTRLHARTPRGSCASNKRKAPIILKPDHGQVFAVLLGAYSMN
jgi:hypothetical protein